jgi:hypothetical protein
VGFWAEGGFGCASYPRSEEGAEKKAVRRSGVKKPPGEEPMTRVVVRLWAFCSGPWALRGSNNRKMSLGGNHTTPYDDKGTLFFF